LVLLLAVMALGTALTGPIVSDVAEPIGISETAVSIWNYAKWVLIALLFVVMIHVIYYASPNVKQRGSIGSRREALSRSSSGCSPPTTRSMAPWLAWS
jgi:uncharacterized BrkB/YihY/UPF0761 family membrane protein